MTGSTALNVVAAAIIVAGLLATIASWALVGAGSTGARPPTTSKPSTTSNDTDHSHRGYESTCCPRTVKPTS
jgi:hypothetical protein